MAKFTLVLADWRNHADFAAIAVCVIAHANVASRLHMAATVKHKERPGQKHDVITLADLAPRHRVTGGSDRRLFGANAGAHVAEGKDHGRDKESHDGSSTQGIKRQGRHRS